MTTMSRIAELIAEKLEIITNLEGLPHRETMSELGLTIKDLNEKERFRTLKLENEYKSFIRTLNSKEIKEMYEEDEEETLEGLGETWENIQQESMLLAEDLLEKYNEEEDEYGEEEEEDAEDKSDFDSDDSNRNRYGLYEENKEENEGNNEGDNEGNNETDEDDEELEENGISALEEEQHESAIQQQKVTNTEEEKKLIVQKIDTVLKKTGGRITRQDLSKITGMKIESNEVRIKALGIKLVSSLLNQDMFIAKKL